MTRWLLAPAPLARVAVLRVVVYLFVPLDVLVTTPWVAAHDSLPPGAYHPLLVGRLLHLPVPTPGSIHLVEALLLVTAVAAAVAAAAGRLQRVLGTAVFLLYGEWMVIAMSYGKVDHDRFAYLVALAVLPTVGRARLRDSTPSEAAGWALRAVQLAVVATYFLSAMAKLRFGGIGWLDSATLVWAVVRRGTALGDPLLAHPQLLHLAQWGIVGFELCSPLMLLLRSRRARAAAVAFFVAFHVVTWLVIRIIFLPHVVCLGSFLALERLVGVPAPDAQTVQYTRRRWSTAQSPQPAATASSA